MDASSFSADDPLPDDVPTLQTLLRQALAEMAHLRAENAELRGKLDAAFHGHPEGKDAYSQTLRYD